MAADRKLLSSCFQKLEDEVNSNYHVFISYRVASERDFAKALFDALSEVIIESTGQRLRVYLDQVRLEMGERWDVGFIQGLRSSWIVVPVISTDALTPMERLQFPWQTVVDSKRKRFTSDKNMGIELYVCR